MSQVTAAGARMCLGTFFILEKKTFCGNNDIHKRSLNFQRFFLMWTIRKPAWTNKIVITHESGNA